MVAIPVYVKHNIMYREGSSGRFDVTIGPKQNMGKTVSTHVVVTFSQVKDNIYNLK
jgi:AP-3 complex subunit mu